MGYSVMTARGPIDAGLLGPTLTHEHLFINMRPESQSGVLNNYPLMVEEVKEFMAVGGVTIVDVTPTELSVGAAPDPVDLVGRVQGGDRAAPDTRDVANLDAIYRLSEETGINVVVGTGHYRDPFLDRSWFEKLGVDGIAELLVRDIDEGMGASNIRAGIIGEIGADKWFVSGIEECSFRAAARAHLRTGLAITTHAYRWPVGLAELDILTSEGVDARRVIIGHCDSVNLPQYHEALARRGAYVQFDTIRNKSPYDTELRVRFVVNLVRKGYLNQILLSHDICDISNLKAYGGGGLSFISSGFRDALRSAGLSDDEFDQIVISNPQHALTGA